jgi:ABC-2 type transport system permease protein
MSSHAAPLYDSATRRPRMVGEIAELRQYRHLVFQLVKRNVTSRYKRSMLGIGWTLLDPLLTMAVMATVYTALLRNRIEAFPVFILSGLVVWNFFSQATTQAMSSFLNGRALLGRVYMPKSALSIASVGTALVNLVCSLAPLLLFMLLFDRRFTPALFFLPVAVLILLSFTVGVGLLLSSWVVFFGDIQNIFNFLLRLMMYLSGLFYSIDMLPEHLQRVLWLVPTYHLIVIFRAPVHAASLPPLDSVLYASAWALVMLLFGLWTFTRNSNAYAYRI